MTELRIILLVAGAIFIAAVAGYEWWRARRDRPAPSPMPEETPAPNPAPAARASLPEINVVREARVSVTDSLPVIELSSTSASGTRRALGISISDEVAVDAAPSGPGAEPPPARKQPYIGHGNRDDQDEVSEVRVYQEQPVHGPQLVIAWPKEEERRIVTLRLVPNGEPRFSGRALRQAFANAGFWHGPLDIYHLPDGQGRIIVSAAALAQPGTFDPSIMDSQRFSGLNLFSVLPGVLSERDTFDELVRAARTLAEWLEGSITDQHGEELTPQRISRLRQSLEAPVQARASGED